MPIESVSIAKAARSAVPQLAQLGRIGGAAVPPSVSARARHETAQLQARHTATCSASCAVPTGRRRLGRLPRYVHLDADLQPFRPGPAPSASRPAIFARSVECTQSKPRRSCASCCSDRDR